jgi:hypothetical protein
MKARATSTKADEGRRRKRLAAFGEGAVGAIGALLVTYAISFVLAAAFLWIANRFFSLGVLRGTTPTAVIALVITVALYLYDRDNP